MKRLAWYLLFVLEGVLFFRGVIFQGKVIPWDLQAFHLPHLYIYADALSRGEFPLWDPSTYCGRPFQANIQTETLYPSIAIAAWIASLNHIKGLLPLLEYNVILHAILAGIFAFRLGQALRLGRSACVLLGSAYQMGAFFAIHAEHMGAVTIAAWIPLAWASTIELGRRFHWRSVLTLALGLAMCVLGGLTPLTVIVFGSVVLLAVLLILFDHARRRLVAEVLAGCGAAFVLTVAQLGPTYELVNHSIAQYRGDWLQSGGGIKLQALITLVSPNYWGAFSLATYHLPAELTFSYLYSGLGTLVLAVLAISAAKHGKHRAFSALLLILALAMLGDSTWIGRVAYRALPMQIQRALHPEFTMPAFLLSLCVLAALGLDRYVRRPRLQWVVVAIVSLDVFFVNSDRIWNAMSVQDSPGITRTSFEGHPEPIARMNGLAGAALPMWRFDTAHGSMPWAMLAPVFGLPTANGNDPLALSRVIHARLAFLDGERWGAYYEPKELASPMLSAMNVKYLVTRQRLSAQDSGASAWKFVADVPGFSIYENAAALPRFWLTGAVTPVPNEDEAWKRIHSAAFAPASEAVVEKFPGPPISDLVPPGTVQVLEYSPLFVKLKTQTARRNYLASSEAAYPGWRSWVDGREVPTYSTDVAFRGLELPPGVHEIIMRFQPRLFYWCASASIAAWLLWLVLWFKAPKPPAEGQLEDS